MKKARCATTLAFAGLIWAGLTSYVLGYRINFSESMPYGVWRETPFNGALKRGDIIVLCLQNSELVKRHVPRQYFSACHNGLEPVLKVAAAIAGDEVKLSPAGVWVNSEPLHNTMPLKYDSQDRPLEPWPFGVYTVEQGKVWLFSTWSPNSFDSRYFGSVSVDTIIAHATPVWVWR